MFQRPDLIEHALQAAIPLLDGEALGDVLSSDPNWSGVLIGGATVPG